MSEVSITDDSVNTARSAFEADQIANGACSYDLRKAAFNAYEDDVIDAAWEHYVQGWIAFQKSSLYREIIAVAEAQLSEMDFRADPAEREKRAELFALWQRARGE